MLFSPAISFFAWASSGLSAERNLAASCSILPSRETATVSLAWAPKSGGSLISCAASGARASNKSLAPRGIDSMDLLLYELQFVAGNLQRQHHLFLGPL